MGTKRKKLIGAISAIVILLLLVVGMGIMVSHSRLNPKITWEENTAENIQPVARLSTSIQPDTSKTIKDHKLVAENENYELYLYEPALSILIRNKDTGSVMESTIQDTEGLSGVNDTWKGFLMSGIVVELQEDTNNIQKKLGLEASNAEIEVTLVDGGFKASIHYPTYDFGFHVEVLLYDDGSITATIPEETIYENCETKRIGNIYLFPLLGESYLAEKDGYMFIPDGNGALIYLDDKEGRFSSGYVQKVYGSDVGVGESYVLSLLWDEYETHNEAENIMVPIFGMVHTKDQLGYLAVIESGEEEASIYATPNGAYSNYNWITAGFRKATTYIQPTSNSGGSVTKVTDRIGYDIKIRYLFVDGEEANYTGLAKRYRNYLLERGDLMKKKDDFKIRLDFLGSDVENWLLFKKSIPMTTVDQIQEIYDDLRSEGVSQILTQYKGWQKGGIYDLPVTTLKADSCIGGTNGLKKLMKQSIQDGIDFYLYADALRANPKTENTVFHTVKKMDKRLYSELTHKDVYSKFVYWTPLKSAVNLESLQKSLERQYCDRLALSGISNTLFTLSINDQMETRAYSKSIYEAIFKSMSENMKLLLEEPLQCYWKYTDAIIDMPITDSDYIFTDQSIPFLSIALKGLIPMYGDYVNFEGNEREYFLQLIETGIYPSFYLTYEDSSALIYSNSNDIYSSRYGVYRDLILSYYQELKSVHEQVEGAYIINHEVMENGLTVVTYDNGVRIYINDTKNEIMVDDMEMPALSYKVGEVK